MCSRLLGRDPTRPGLRAVAPLRPGEASFALSPDTWAELAVPLRAPTGRVRITVYAEPLRVPRERVPGSGGSRGLGLAIKGLWLAR